MRSTAFAPDRAPLHRALVRFPLERKHGIAGIAIAVLIIAGMVTFSRAVWNGEANGVKALLKMSHTPYAIKPPPNPAPGLLGGTIKGGATFSVHGSTDPVPWPFAVLGIVAFASSSLVAIRWRRVPVPAKVLWLLFAVLGVATLAYTGFVSGTPPHPIDQLTIGFQRGGLLAVMVAAVLFAFEVFPLPGPLRIKISWLAALVVFSFAWSIVRMAFVLATVNHVGSWTFLYLQYIAGPMVDFLSVVAFYSLVTHGLARRLAVKAAL